MASDHRRRLTDTLASTKDARSDCLEMCSGRPRDAQQVQAQGGIQSMQEEEEKEEESLPSSPLGVLALVLVLFVCACARKDDDAVTVIGVSAGARGIGVASA